MSPTISLNDKIFKAKNFLKSVFGTVIMPINKCCYIMLHGVKLILNVCLWKRIPYCLYAQPMFVFWTCRMNHKQDTNQPNPMCSTVMSTYPANKKVKEKVTCVGAEQKSWTIFATCAHVLWLLKDKLQECFEEREWLHAVAFYGCACYYCDYPQFIANWIVHDTKSQPRP